MTITCVAFILLAAAAADPPKPDVRLKELKEELKTIEKTFREELRADRTQQGILKANDKYFKALEAWRAAGVEAVRKNPDLPEAFEVIVRLLARGGGREVPELVGLLRMYHAARPDLGKFFISLVQSRTKEGREFIEEMAEKSPVEAVRAQAAYALGWQAKWRITEDGDKSLGFGTKLSEEERKRLEDRAQKYLTLAAKSDNVPMIGWGGKVGPTARGELLGLKNIPALRVGQIAPDIAGEAVDGTKFKLSQHRGKVTVLVFWASWCGPCMKMVPREKELAERMKGRPFALVGVNGDDEREKATEAVKKHGITWQSFWDAAERTDGPITKAWNVHVWPTIYILDGDGVIRHVGHSETKLDELVDKEIGKLEKK